MFPRDVTKLALLAWNRGSVRRPAVGLAGGRVGADLRARPCIHRGRGRREPERGGARLPLAPGIVPTRRRTFLEDDWSLGATKSLLGASLVALGRNDEAEAVLLEARRDLDSLAAPRSAESKAAALRLVELYISWGRHERAAVSRALLGS